MKANPIAILPVLVALMAVVSFLTPSLSCMTDNAFALALRFISACLLAACGMGLVLWSGLELQRANTTGDALHPEKTTHLLTSGPFALSRNPIYLGGAL